MNFRQKNCMLNYLPTPRYSRHATGILPTFPNGDDGGRGGRPGTRATRAPSRAGARTLRRSSSTAAATASPGGRAVIRAAGARRRPPWQRPPSLPQRVSTLGDNINISDGSIHRSWQGIGGPSRKGDVQPWIPLGITPTCPNRVVPIRKLLRWGGESGTVALGPSGLSGPAPGQSGPEGCVRRPEGGRGRLGASCRRPPTSDTGCRAVGDAGEQLRRTRGVLRGVHTHTHLPSPASSLPSAFAVAGGRARGPRGSSPPPVRR